MARMPGAGAAPGAGLPGGGGGGGGIMEFLKSPAFGTYISGLGRGLVKADQGQGFDMGDTPQLMAQMMAQREQQEKFRGLMESLGGQLTPEQKQYLQAVGPEAGMKLLGQQVFQGPEDQAEWERKAQYMVENFGVDPYLAYGANTGMIRSGVNPFNEQPYALDIGQLPRGGTAGPAGGAPPAGTASQAPSGAAAPEAQPEAKSASEAPPKLWDLAEGTTGVGPTLKEWATDTLGQMPGEAGDFFTFGDTVSRRQYFSTAKRDLVRALQNNPRYAEGERKAIEEEIKVGPEFWGSEEGLRSRMVSVDRSLRERLKDEVAVARDQSQPPEHRQAAQQTANAIQRYLRLLGVPQEAYEQYAPKPSGNGGDESWHETPSGVRYKVVD